MADFNILPATHARTRQASNPSSSAFVSANAGSGKTHVLAQRVTRLLLAGNAPSCILCLTFTKAAAAEMQTRVFKDLRNWSMLPDEELDRVLRKLDGSDAATSAELRTRARRLFAQALETPGGLRIQTIHAFCEALLHQFPLEAGIAGHFEVMDDALRDSLLTAATSSAVTQAFEHPEREDGAALSAILDQVSEFGLREGLSALTDKREAFRAWVPNRQSMGGALNDLAQALGLQADISADALIRTFLDAHCPPIEMLRRHAALDGARNGAQGARAANASTLANSTDFGDRFAAAIDLLLTSDSKTKERKIRGKGQLANKLVHEEMPQLLGAYEAAGEALLAIEGHVAAARAHDLTSALVTIGHRVLQHFEQEKAARGALDFADLVSRVALLLQTGTARHWVQYKLDRGIDHVLVDEAQDTSPPQWAIVRKIIEDYFSGAGASGTAQKRTVFAVGDEKQSIYSFQGARPDLFGGQRLEIKSLAQGARHPFADVTLTQSFRTSKLLLDAVDEVFANPLNSAGIATNSAVPPHETARTGAPGEVQIWGWEDKAPRPEEEDWFADGDPLAARSPEAKLAERLAADMKCRVDAGESPGDMLALVRSRGIFMEALTGALKRLGLPVSGVDRFGLTDHIAVQDLMALGRAVLMETDDLSLAAALKSPLLGLNEDDLFDVARHGAAPDDPLGRGDRSLYDAFRSLAQTGRNSRVTDAHDRFTRWRGLAHRYGVFGFYAAVLHTDGGRARLLARLGGEAEDPVDTFLDFALSRENEGVPGIDGYLQWLQNTAPEVKRQLEQTQGRIRVMTAHGAKGLEARTVYLVDPGSAPQNKSRPDRIIALPAVREGSAAPLLWQAPGQTTTQAGQTHAQMKAQAEDEEYRRLLYVGMTRARDRLIVCGYRKTDKTQDAPDGERRWRDIVQAALVSPHNERRWQQVQAEEYGLPIWRWYDPDNALPNLVAERSVEVTDAPMPDHLRAAPPTEGPAMESLSPSTAHRFLEAEDTDLTMERDAAAISSAGEARSPALYDDEATYAARKGTIIHRLLEQLPSMPAAERQRAALTYIARMAPDWSEAEHSKIADQTVAVMQLPELKELFGGRAEVAVSGTIETGRGTRTVSGRIDQMVVGESVVTIADYKTNHHVPNTVDDAPDAYIAQMAIYRALLASTFPNHSIEALLIWTAEPKIMRLPDDVLDARLVALTGL
ncbi:MAG: double-strand break repair helicase AddA [Pseudomonadota bacterium]